MSNDLVLLEERLAQQGFAFVPAETMHHLLAPYGALEDWPHFAASWDDLGLDTYMADGGRYRKRRFGVFGAVRGGTIWRKPHQPHFQSRDYNPLNGGIERWFLPITDSTAASGAMQGILAFSQALFEKLAPPVRQWHIEVHQFRIEAQGASAGKPTPEGLHRDGVDFVLVLMIRRENVDHGETAIHGLGGELLGTFTLKAPLDAALVDDARVYHGVTPVVPIDPARPAFRDVLVVTFRRDGPLA
jgi:hypothetical protein